MLLKFKYFVLLILSFSIVNSTFSQSPDGYPTVANLDTFPIPTVKNLLFYIQKNANTNTITYEAILDEDGNLDEDEPLKVYWYRYQEDSTTRDLNFIERLLAYGLNVDKIKGKNGYFRVTLKADKSRIFTLFLDENKIPRMQTIIDNKPAYIKHVFAQIEGPTIWPKVIYADIWGEDPKTGKKIFERMIVNRD